MLLIPLKNLWKTVSIPKSSLHKTICALFISALFTCLSVLPATAAAKVLTPDLPELSVYEAEAADSGGFTIPKVRSSFPSSYNSVQKGFVTPVRDQDPFGTCWAFSAIGAAESNLLKRGVGSASSLNLSEFHFAYFFYNTVADALGNTTGDENAIKSGENYLDFGGSDVYNIFALAKWTGAAYESTAPYSQAGTMSLNSTLAYQDAAHLQNARIVPGKDSSGLKNLILEYGAVSASVCMTGGKYFNSSNGAYYYNGSANILNHQLLLVGWDDNYSANNFNAANRPEEDGAWIAKNSYGTELGNQGYFYISYYDKGITSSNALDVAYGMESSSNYDYNYEYDGTAVAAVRALPSGSSIANTFTVKGNGAGRECLEAISFAVFSQNIQYAIQIYKNPDTSNPVSGTPCFDNAQTGATTYAGYYTIPLNEKLVFNEGDSFSVVISMGSSDSNNISCFMDQTTTENNITFHNAAAKGQSFYRERGSTWTDISELGINNRIKAFTNKTTASATVIRIKISSLATSKLRSIKGSSCTQATLTWKSILYAHGYEIYRSTSKNGKYKKITTAYGTSFTDTTLKSGTRYYYKLRAFGYGKNGTVTGAFSNIKSITVWPDRVVSLSVKAVSKKKVLLSWKKVAGCSGYRIEYRAPGSGSWKKAKSVTGSVDSTKVTIEKSGTWRFRIRAYKKAGKKAIYGSYSKTIKIKK